LESFGGTSLAALRFALYFTVSAYAVKASEAVSAKAMAAVGTNRFIIVLL
jgi:hypothetical protein